MNRFVGALALAILCPIFIFARHTEVILEDNQTSLRITGNKTFSGLTNITNLNGVQKCDQFAGATLDVQLNACIAAAEATSVGALGIADARAMRNGTLAAEVDVGGPGSAVVLLLPHNGYWTATMTGGTAYALKVNDQSSAIGYGSGEGQAFVIQAGATSNLDSVCGTSPGSGGYTRMEGFACTALPGATVGNAILNVQDLADESYVGKMTAITYSSNASKVLWVHGNCCAAMIELINAEGNYTTNAIPCTFGSPTGADFQIETNIRNTSCVHPGSGENSVVLGQYSTGLPNYGNHIEKIYMEYGGGSDLTTAAFSVTGVQIANSGDFIDGLLIGGDSAGSTRYLLQLASGTRVDAENLTMGPVSTNAVNDLNYSLSLTFPIYGTIHHYGWSPSYFGAVSGTLFTGNRGTAQTTGNITLPAGWGTSSSVALAGPSTQYTEYNEFTITSGSGSFAAAPTVQVVFPTAFPSAPVCSLVVGGITGSGGAIIFKQTAQSATQTTFTAYTSTGAAFTPAASETYTVFMQCGL